ATQAVASIRPATVTHVHGAAVDASADDVVPVRQVLANPPWPVMWAALTAVLVGLLAVLAVNPPALTPPAKGALLVAGQDAATVPEVDLAKPFSLRAQLPGARGADEVLLRLSVAGVPLVSPSPGKPAANGTVPVNASASRFLAAGTVDAKATFRRNGRELTSISFPLRSKRSAFTTLPGAGAIVALLFLLAYGQSQLTPMRRRGRRRWSSLVGLLIVGAGLGAVAAVFAWLTGTHTLTTSALVRCAVVGAAAAVALGVTTYKAGRRARLRRIARKQGLSLS
ncbi:MAG: hypothetical protein WCD35_16565, partial [Mycobacteriales bacterium]